MYTCNESPCPQASQIIQANLATIGIDVEIKQFERAVQFSKEGTKGEPFDIADEGWVADYNDPYDFINVLLDGKGIRESNNVNFSYFNDPKYNQRMEEAAGLAGEERFKNYGKLDLDIAKNASPLAAWDNDNERDFFSGADGLPAVPAGLRHGHRGDVPARVVASPTSGAPAAPAVTGAAGAATRRARGSRRRARGRLRRSRRSARPCRACARRGRSRRSSGR